MPQHEIYVSHKKLESYRSLPQELREEANRKAREAFYDFLEENAEED
jgi:hypothetical protein